MKNCRKCGLPKDEKADPPEFPRDQSQKDGFSNMCKACWKLRGTTKGKAQARKRSTANVPVIAIPAGLSVIKLNNLSKLPVTNLTEWRGPLGGFIQNLKVRYDVTPSEIYQFKEDDRFFAVLPRVGAS